MKRAIVLFLLLIFFFLNVGSVNLYPESLESINEVDISLVDSSLTQLHQGVYNFTATVQNTGDPATTGDVPISWEKDSHALPLTNGIGTLEESVADYDINGDGDKVDTFAVEWNDTIRPWDAEIDGVYVYALADHSVNPGFNRTYYVDGEPKLFQLGNKMHSLYSADNDVAYLGFDAVILKHPSPSFELIIYSNVSVIDFNINGEPVVENHSWTGVEMGSDGTRHPYTAYVVPNQASEISTDETMEFSCTIIARETTTCEVALLTNWSPNGNIRYRWVPFDQVDVLFEAINRPFFIGTSLDVMDVNTGVKQFEATVKNIGAPATTGTVPISWEELYYELPLDDGNGTLVENDVGFDLNGDGDTLDSFNVTWYPNDGRQYDVLINDGVQDIHAYSLTDEYHHVSINRSYYIDGNPKLFQLGSETHSLYKADNDQASFGLGEAVIRNHPSPNFELLIEHEGEFPVIHATDFEINESPAELNITWSWPLQLTSSADLWSDMVYIVPNNTFKIDQDEEVTFSCKLIAHEAKTCDVILIMNWSPDGNIRYIYVPFDEEMTFNLPDFSLVDSTLASSEPGVYQLTATFRNNGYSATPGNMPITWEKLYYELPLSDGEGILDEGVVDYDLNGNGDKLDQFGVVWSSDEHRQWDATVGGIHVYSLCEGPPDDPWSIRTYNINKESKLFQLGTETHFLYLANNELAAFGLGDAVLIEHPSPNFQLQFETIKVSATDFRINNNPVEVNYTWSGKVREMGEIIKTPRNYIIPSESSQIGAGVEVTLSCTLSVTETVICDIGILINWSPDDNTRIRWFPYWEEDVPFEAPTITLTTPTTTPETTPTKFKTTSESVPTIPGFSFLTTLLIVLPVLIYIRKRKNT